MEKFGYLRLTSRWPPAERSEGVRSARDPDAPPPPAPKDCRSEIRARSFARSESEIEHARIHVQVEPIAIETRCQPLPLAAERSYGS
eukprot:scaffold630_cov218-Pinguiococcus_pyrenoidosus.AAC.10